MRGPRERCVCALAQMVAQHCCHPIALSSSFSSSSACIFFFVFFVHVSANTRWTRNISNSRARWYTIQNIIIDYLYHFIEFFFTCSGAVIKISRSRCRTLSAASNWRRHVNCGMRRRQLFSVRTKSESDLFTIDSTKYMRGIRTSAASEPIDHSCRIISVSMPQNKQ